MCRRTSSPPSRASLENTIAEPMEGSRPPVRASARRRRALATVIAAALTATVWLTLFRDGGSDGTGGEERGHGVSEPVAALVQDLTAEQRVDTVLLLGFDGTEAERPILAQLRRHDLGGVLIGSQNFSGAGRLANLTGALRA